MNNLQAVFGDKLSKGKQMKWFRSATAALRTPKAQSAFAYIEHEQQDSLSIKSSQRPILVKENLGPSRNSLLMRLNIRLRHDLVDREQLLRSYASIAMEATHLQKYQSPLLATAERNRYQIT
jgi:hypothetical protein